MCGNVRYGPILMSDSAKKQSEIEIADGPRVSRLIREEIARRRISRQAVADMAQISISTLEKALAGKRSFTLATLIRLEKALGLELRDAPPKAPAAVTMTMASADLGSYTRPAVKWMEGEYLTIRPGFNDAQTLYTYYTSIRWDDARGALTFCESGRQDKQFEQSGLVSMPYMSSHIYLVTNEDGQFRMAVLGRSSKDSILFGILSTLFVGDGTQLIPLSCPIALQRLTDGERPDVGLIAPDSDRYAPLRALLDRTVGGGFARFHL
jgi:transcriptional regulator with XRE-family HTH domain